MMEQCLSPADMKGTKPKQGTGILKKMKKNLKPIRSTAQSDREVTQSETNEDQEEETDHQKSEQEVIQSESAEDRLTAHSELLASNDSLPDISSAEGSEFLKKIKKNLRPVRSAAQSDKEASQSQSTENYGEETNTQKDRLTAHSELSVNNDSLSEISNTEDSGFLKKMKKNLRPVKSSAQSDQEASQSESTVDHGEETNTQKDSLTAHSELSASNDSLTDISNAEGSGFLKKIKKNLRPLISAAQVSFDADTLDPPETHSTTEMELEPPDNTQKKGGKLVGMFRKSPKPAERSVPVQEIESAPTELSGSNESLPDVNTQEKGDKFTGWFRKASKPAESLRPAQEDESTHSELSANSDSALDINAKEKGGMFSGIFKKSPKTAESILPAQEDESIKSELSASNDSLSDNNTKEKGGIFSGMFKSKPQKNSKDPAPVLDSLSTHIELSSSSNSLSEDNNTKIVRDSSQLDSTEKHKEETDNAQDKTFGGVFRKIQKERTVTFTSYVTGINREDKKGKPGNKLVSFDADTMDPPETHSTTEMELDPPDNTQIRGAKFPGFFRKSPKPAESTLPAQEDDSISSELSASNDSLSDNGTKEKGGMFSGMFKKSHKPAESTLPAQDDESIKSELSASNDSLSDNNTKEKGGMFSGMFKKSHKPAESTLPAQDGLSANTDLSGSTDSLTDDNAKKKGGKFTGLFQKSPKPAESTLPVQENESIKSELSASNDSLSDNNTKEKGGMFSGMFKKSPKPAESTLPVQDDESIKSELSASNDSLSDNNTKEKGGMFSGMFKKSPKPAESTLPGQEDEESDLSARHTNLLDVNPKEKGGMFSGMFRSKSPKRSKDPAQENVLGSTDGLSDSSYRKVSMGTEGGSLAVGDEKESFRRKKRVSFRVKRTLPRVPQLTLQPVIKESEEQELLPASFEMKELPSMQESSVEVQMVEMAPLPNESNPRDTTEDDDDDGLLDWWRTVEGWNEWNESSNFQEDEEELAIEQAADRVFLGAQLFVRLFNQRGASLQKQILELLNVADMADNFHKRALQASMGGRVASVVGSVTTITGLILAPFTFGSSIIVTAVGIGVATAGTITSASAHITDSVHSTLDRKKVEKMIEGYQDEMKDIRECMEFVQEGMDALQGWNFEKYTDSVAKRALNRNIKHVVKEGARAGKALMINTDKLVSTVQVLSVAGGAAKAAQAISVTTGVMSALFLALDIFFLAKDSHDLRKGAKTKFAKKLREVCKELQDGLLELNRVKTALQKTMDGIEVEEFEEEEEEEEEEENEKDLDLESDPEKLAQLEEEIDQIEQKLDQEVLEKKREAEEERRKEMRRNDSKEDHVNPQGGKMEKREKKLETVKVQGEVKVEKEGKVESEGGKCAINELPKERNKEDENEERTKEKRQRYVTEEKKKEGDEQGKSGKREGYEQGQKERRGEDEWRKNAKVERDEQGKSGKREGYEQGQKERRGEDEWTKNAKVERDEQGKKESKEGDERWKVAKRDSIPPPARPRSKAISHNTEETRKEGSIKDPKAQKSVPHKRSTSQREPLSI